MTHRHSESPQPTTKHKRNLFLGTFAFLFCSAALIVAASTSATQRLLATATTAETAAAPANSDKSTSTGIKKELSEVTQYFQGFEADGDWSGTTVARVASGSDGITSKTGGFHAELIADDFTRWGGYNSVFPTYGYTTSIDLYLDTAGGAANDTRFNYSSAINNIFGDHRRDFVFSCGFYNDAVAPGTGNRFVCSASNNSPGFPKDPGRTPTVVTAGSGSGWYTFKHTFYNNGSGVLAVKLTVSNPSGAVVGQWTLSDPSDVIGSTVGGNRYGWLVTSGFPFLAADNTKAATLSEPTVVRVTADDLTATPNATDWFFYNDENDTIDNNLGSFVAGPSAPPMGIGSAQISVTGTQRRSLATYQFAGTPLADINELKYSTYNPTAGNGGADGDESGYLNFNVDFDGSDTWQKRLVFLPFDNGTVTHDAWKEWDAINSGNALWRYSGATWPVDGVSGDTPKTWSQILTQYPGIRIRVSDPWLGIRVGEPYPDGYTENIDAFKFSSSTVTRYFDFEPPSIVVDDDGFASPNDCDDPSTPANTTIQDGINAALPGQIVKVCPGVYIEDVNVNKATLIIQGSGAANTTILGPYNSGGGNTVLISAGGVTLDGFTITRQGNTVALWAGNTHNQGINVAASSNAVIQNNILTGNRNAIYVGQSSYNVIIRHNTIDNNRTGIHLVDNNGGLIEENNITNNWTMGILYRCEGCGIDPSPLTVRGNNISGNWYSEIEFREPAGSSLLNMGGNYFGTPSPTRVTTPSGEPGYLAQIPVVFGGTAVPPGAHPTIAGAQSARVDYSPYLRDGTDTDPLTPGFQGSLDSIGVNADSPQAFGTMNNLTEGLAATASGGTLYPATGFYGTGFAPTGKAIALSPGSSPGQVTINDDFALDSNDALNIEINGASAAQYDSVAVNGTVTLNGATLDLSSSFLPSGGSTFTIIANDATDAVTGTFNGLAEGATVSVGATQYTISYAGGDGNDVVLTTTVATCNVVSVPTGVTSLTGVTVDVPINVDDLTGRGAFGYDTSITFNPAVLAYNSIIQTGTISSGLTIIPNFGTPGVLNLSAASTGADSLMGSGVLLYVRFNVIGAIGSTSAVSFSNFVFNEGNPCSTTSNGLVTVISGQITGHVTYINGIPTTPGVPNVNLSGAGSVNVSDLTDSNGDYLLSGFGPGAYTVTPSKAPLPLASSNPAISNSDSTRIAQHIVGLITLNANQIIAGDVTNNGAVSNLDRTYIAQWKVGITNPGVTGTWIFQPTSKPYANVNASVGGENYDAILKGDVTGNWDPLLPPFFAPLTAENMKAPSKDAVVFKPGSVMARSGGEVVVPVSISDLSEKGVTGYEFDVQYDPNVLEPADIGATSEKTLSSGMSVFSNAPEKGLLKVFVSGIYPMEGKGDLLDLHFRAIGEAGSSSRITLTNWILNEGEIESTAIQGSVRISKAANGTIRGRVISERGRGVSGAIVFATDSAGKRVSVRSNSFGRFEIGGLNLGETYTLETRSRRGRGSSVTIALTANVVEVDVLME